MENRTFCNIPSEIAKGGIDEKGYYTAIILSVFKAETNNDTYLWDNVKKIGTNTNKILSNVKEWVKKSDQISLDSISKNQILMTIPINVQYSQKRNNRCTWNTARHRLEYIDSIKSLWTGIYDKCKCWNLTRRYYL